MLFFHNMSEDFGKKLIYIAFYTEKQLKTLKKKKNIYIYIYIYIYIFIKLCNIQSY